MDSDSGNIDLGSISGPLEATGHAGVIRGQDVSSPRATLHSSAGTIDMAFSAAPATLTATSDIGSVTLRVPGSLSYNVTTNVGVGSTVNYAGPLAYFRWGRKPPVPGAGAP